MVNVIEYLFRRNIPILLSCIIFHQFARINTEEFKRLFHSYTKSAHDQLVINLLVINNGYRKCDSNFHLASEQIQQIHLLPQIFLNPPGLGGLS